MLCLSPELHYLHEPFNPGIWPRWTAEAIPQRNLYVCAENEASYLAPVGAILARRFPWWPQVREARSPARAARLLRATVVHRLGRSMRGATLMKDPIAIFSTEWLAERFDLDVVVMVRGPLAFASSIKRLAWAFDFANWTRQPLLLRDVLGEFAAEIERAAHTPPDLIDQAILTWNATYAFVDRARRTHPGWSVVGYEHLAAHPIDGFRDLYGALGLAYDEPIQRGIERHSARGNAPDAPDGDKGGITRDSRAALGTWRIRLTPDEVERVRVGTASVAERLAPILTEAS
jgi:hypothetical protein